MNKQPTVWILITATEPPNGAVAMTCIYDWEGLRNEQFLKRSGRLWYLTDGSMYVYYRPTHYAPSTMILAEARPQ